MESESQQAYINPNVRGLVPSPTLAINEKCREIRSKGREVYSLGFGQSPFPVPNSLVKALKANAFQKDYLPVRGLPELRAAVAGYINRKQGLEATANDVLIGPGSKELMFVLQLVHEADLLLPSPTWVSYCPQAEILGQKVHWIRTRRDNDWRLQPEELDEYCSKNLTRHALLVLTYPGNPTGNTYDAEELKALAEVAKKHDLIVLSDEIYGELRFEGEHVSIARFYPEGTIISGGLSKWCGAGGWRLGTFTFPPRLQNILKSMGAVASETYSTTSAPIQFAAVQAFLGDPDVENYVLAVRRVLKGLGGWVSERLKEAGAFVAPPEGAYYLFPDFSSQRDKINGKTIETAEEFCMKLLDQTGVALLPGHSFGRDESELSARLAYVDFDGAQVLEASLELEPHQSIDEKFMRKHCGHVLTGIEKLCDWVAP